MKWFSLLKKQTLTPQPQQIHVKEDDSDQKKVFADMNAWKRSDNRLFNFNEIKHWLEPYTIEDIRAAVENENVDLLGDHIQLVWDIPTPRYHDHVFYWCYAVFPNGIAVNFNFESYDTHNHDNPELLEYLTIPVYAEDDGTVDASGFDCIEDIPWEESDKPVETLSFGGQTDFYEKIGWWPHIQMHHHTTNEKHWEPLCYIGEIKLNNQILYMFQGTKLHDTKYFAELVEDRNVDPMFAAIQKDDPVIPSWVKPQQLHGNTTGVYYDIQDMPNIDKRITPTAYFPKISTGCQADYILNAPFNNFVYQIPVIWNGYKKNTNGDYTIRTSASYTISHNNQGEFRAVHQDT